MTGNGREWNPLDSRSWAQFLGLVHVHMFGGGELLHSGQHSVLLDGDKSSFALSKSNEPHWAFESIPTSWAWSSGLRHALIIHEHTSQMFLRRWDAPSGAVRRFRVPGTPAGAIELLDLVKKSPAPRHDDVILFVLRAFRIVRNTFSSPDGLDAIKALNILLLGTEAVRKSELAESTWKNCRTINDAVRVLEGKSISEENFDISSRLGGANVGEQLFEYFLTPEPMSGCQLEPELLLRHASGRLYQEAHLFLEKEFRQRFIPGLAPDTSIPGILMRDVRFTPPSLARVIVEQAFDALGDLATRNEIEILDPACGSGVFLQEALRELAQRSYSGTITIRGFDTSAISCTIASFCVERAKQDSGLTKVQIKIIEQDSLLVDWGDPDIVLMNPPFVPWDRMDEANQGIVKSTLGGLAKFRADMAMAFIWKAAEKVATKGILASILPAPLFETQSGELWRQALSDIGNLKLLGRFVGYGYFRGSIVEPGVLILQKRESFPPSQAADVKILIAQGGYEDDAIRALRQDTEGSRSPREWDVFRLDRTTLSSASWMPRFRESMLRSEFLAEKGLPTVEDLFAVRQGTRTGHNKAFVLKSDELNSLPRKERAFFRPIASNSTIHDGTIDAAEYVFFPYGASGATITTEKELNRNVPKYAEGWLFPNKVKLKSRGKIDENKWWLLTWPRTWQYELRPKLVSTYFGDRGSFAFDTKGETVVLQGYVWLWKKAKTGAFRFVHSPLPWAYLAILNSGIFEQLLESACPRVQGGQFNLSTRFVNTIYLPNLSDDMQVSGNLVEELAEIGRKISSKKWPALEEIDEVVGRAYGLPTSPKSKK